MVLAHQLYLSRLVQFLLYARAAPMDQDSLTEGAMLNRDSVVSAAWLVDSLISDGSVVLSPRPVAVSTGNQRRAVVDLRKAADYDDSSSSLGLLPPQVLADVDLMQPALAGRQSLQTVSSKSMKTTKMAAAVRDASVDEDMILPEIKVDPGELEDLVAGFAESDSELSSHSPVRSCADTLIDQERTVCSDSHRVSTTDVEKKHPSLVKITDTVYKKKDKAVENLLPKGLKDFQSVDAVKNDSAQLFQSLGNAYSTQCAKISVNNNEECATSGQQSEEFISDPEKIRELLKGDEPRSLSMSGQCSWSQEANEAAQNNLTDMSAYFKGRLRSVSSERCEADGQQSDNEGSASIDGGDQMTPRLQSTSIPQKRLQCELPTVLVNDNEHRPSTSTVENEDNQVQYANTPTARRPPLNNTSLTPSIWQLSKISQNSAVLSPWARQLLENTNVANNTSMLADLILRTKASLSMKDIAGVPASHKVIADHRSDCLAPGGRHSHAAGPAQVPVQLKGKRCVAFGCVDVGEKVYCTVPVRFAGDYGQLMCKVHLRHADNNFKIESLDPGSTLLFNSKDTHQLTVSFKPSRVGFHAAKIVLVVERVNQDLKIVLNGWGGRANVTLLNDGRQGCLLGARPNWSLKLKKASVPENQPPRYCGSLCVHNSGALAAFVKMLAYQDATFRTPLAGDCVTIQPANYILPPNCRKAFSLNLNVTKNVRVENLYVAVLWGDEVIRRNLRPAESRKKTVFKMYGTSFCEKFVNEEQCSISVSQFTGSGEGALFTSSLHLFPVNLLTDYCDFDSSMSCATLDINDTESLLQSGV